LTITASKSPSIAVLQIFRAAWRTASFISSWRLLISDALSVLVSGLVGPIDRVGQSLVVQRLLLVARRCSLP
jgi:hypothetical protein